MKKLILIISIVLLFISCTPDEAQWDEACECYKQTWVNDNNNGWYWNGTQEYYSNDCTDDGDSVGQPYSGQGWQVKYIVKCN